MRDLRKKPVSALYDYFNSEGWMDEVQHMEYMDLVNFAPEVARFRDDQFDYVVEMVGKLHRNPSEPEEVSNEDPMTEELYQALLTVRRIIHKSADVDPFLVPKNDITIALMIGMYIPETFLTNAVPLFVYTSAIIYQMELSRNEAIACRVVNDAIIEHFKTMYLPPLPHISPRLTEAAESLRNDKSIYTNFRSLSDIINDDVNHDNIVDVLYDLKKISEETFRVQDRFPSSQFIEDFNRMLKDTYKKQKIFAKKAKEYIKRLDEYFDKIALEIK